MELIEFNWATCRDGYMLVDQVPLSDREKEYFRYRRECITYFESPWIMRRSQRMEHYRLPPHRAMFEIFANSDSTPAGMLSFYNIFGPLDATVSLDLGTPLNWVLGEQERLRNAVRSLNSGDPGELIVALELDQPGTLNPRLRPAAPESQQLTFVPRSLREAMWVQLAIFAASPGAKLWICEWCGAPFFVGAGTNRRKTAKYCSGRCKVTASRARQT
jgi:hypothetical protein